MAVFAIRNFTKIDIYYLKHLSCTGPENALFEKRDLSKFKFANAYFSTPIFLSRTLSSVAQDTANHEEC